MQKNLRDITGAVAHCVPRCVCWTGKKRWKRRESWILCCFQCQSVAELVRVPTVHCFLWNQWRFHAKAHQKHEFPCPKFYSNGKTDIAPFFGSIVDPCSPKCCVWLAYGPYAEDIETYSNNWQSWGVKTQTSRTTARSMTSASSLKSKSAYHDTSLPWFLTADKLSSKKSACATGFWCSFVHLPSLDFA